MGQELYRVTEARAAVAPQGEKFVLEVDHLVGLVASRAACLISLLLSRAVRTLEIK